MANGWGNNENSERLYFWGLQNHCRWWVQPWSKKMLAPWKKRYDQPRQHIKKLRHYFADKGLSSQSCDFLLVIYGCESWTIRKAEHWKTDTFGFWCWRRLLRVTWTARRSTQSILKEISPEYSLERLMLKLKLQFFDQLMQRTDSLEKTALGKIEGRRRRGKREWDGWMASPTQCTWIWAKSGSWWWPGKSGVLPLTTRGEDWASQGQPKRKPEIPIVTRESAATWEKMKCTQLSVLAH